MKKNLKTFPLSILSSEKLPRISFSIKMSFLTYFRYCGLCIPRVCSRTPFETSPLCQVQCIHNYYDLSLLLISLNISILFRFGPWKIQEVRFPHLQILAGKLNYFHKRSLDLPHNRCSNSYDSQTHERITTFLEVFLHFQTYWIVRQ